MIIPDKNLDKSNKYTLTKDFLNKKDFLQKYGKKSFAFLSEKNGVFDIVAVSSLEPQYLKTELLIDNVNFYGVDTTMDIETFSEVI